MHYGGKGEKKEKRTRVDQLLDISRKRGEVRGSTKKIEKAGLPFHENGEGKGVTGHTCHKKAVTIGSRKTAKKKSKNGTLTLYLRWRVIPAFNRYN